VGRRGSSGERYVLPMPKGIYSIDENRMVIHIRLHSHAEAISLSSDSNPQPADDGGFDLRVMDGGYGCRRWMGKYQTSRQGYLR
jgi:hypothetical protein